MRRFSPPLAGLKSFLRAATQCRSVRVDDYQRDDTRRTTGIEKEREKEKGVGGHREVWEMILTSRTMCG